jgi:flagellar hook-associated protein 2
VSSPITFSGFNNIDFNVVLNALMQQASLPLTLLQGKQDDLRSQVSNFDALNTKIESLRTAADGLATTSGVSTLAGTSSDPAVSVSASTTASAGSYAVVVTELARAQVTASTSVAPDATTTVVASGGSLTIGGVSVAVSGNVTLQDLATQINATSGIGVTAAVVRTGTNSYKLALTSQQTGLANAFSVTNGLTGGTGVTFGGTNAVDASDAAITFNNIAVTSSSNSFTDITPGVTLTVSAKDPAKTIAVTVAPDTTALTAKVNDFISAYNDTISYIETQRTAAGGGDTGSIGRDPLLRQLRSSLRNELLGAHGSAAFTRLAEVGIEFTRDGTMTLNQAVFDDAVATNGADVRTLFAGTGGAFPAIETLLDGYGQTSGTIPSVKTRLNAQISAMDDQIADMQARLALQRSALQQEFTEADTAMSRLNSQSNSIANIGSSLGSF